MDEPQIPGGDPGYLRHLSASAATKSDNSGEQNREQLNPFSALSDSCARSRSAFEGEGGGDVYEEDELFVEGLDDGLAQPVVEPYMSDEEYGDRPDEDAPLYNQQPMIDPYSHLRMKAFITSTRIIKCTAPSSMWSIHTLLKQNIIFTRMINCVATSSL